MSPTAPEGWQPDYDPGLPFAELRTTGLLWLINRQIFHPRGFALAVVADMTTGDVSGWKLLGDGREPWNFADGDEAPALAAAETFLAQQRSAAAPMAPTRQIIEALTNEAVVMDRDRNVYQLAVDTNDGHREWGCLDNLGVSIYTDDEMLSPDLEPLTVLFDPKGPTS